jgi:hypothetical protein
MDRHLYGDEDTYKGHFLYWIEEWSQIAGRCNWYTFRPILIEFEHDKIMGGLEATIILLGVGLRWRWNYAITKQAAIVLKQVAEIDKEFDGR